MSSRNARAPAIHPGDRPDDRDTTLARARAGRYSWRKYGDTKLLRATAGVGPMRDRAEQDIRDVIIVGAGFAGLYGGYPSFDYRRDDLHGYTIRLGRKYGSTGR
ncbi:hypothetical protein GCM10027089_01520 [Nocardia thraciensis]